MMGRTLQFYFFFQAFRMILMFMIVVAALAYLIDFTEFSNRTGGLPMYSVSFALLLSAMRIPYILEIALPFIILFATTAMLMLLNRKYELVVARSVGVSAWQFLFPVMGAALLTGVLTILVVNPLGTKGYAYATSIEGEWRARPSKSPLAQERPWLRQAQEDGGSMLIGASRSTTEGMRLFDVVFLDLDANNSMRRRIDAAEAQLGDQQWLLSEVEISEAGKTTIERDSMTIPTALDPSVIQQALIAPKMISIFELGGQIDAAKSFGVSANPFRMQYHSLLATPALFVAMALVAATVSMRFVRSGQSAGMILGGMAAGFMLYVVTAVTSSFGSAGIIPPVLAAWLPVAVATLFGVAYLLHREDG
ncbi:MAG: LPS export ABC transporter permease LptG [Ahrensia sp.]|nr:LPS export ABC transporter permease LptG [Ahrensia sp.]